MFSFFFVVVDGPSGRLLGHESFTERQRSALTHIIANAGKDASPPLITQAQLELAAERVVENNYAEAKMPTSSVVNKRTMAKHQGYTGDACTQCHGFRIKQTGKCTVCEDCGATSGCS